MTTTGPAAPAPPVVARVVPVPGVDAGCPASVEATLLGASVVGAIGVARLVSGGWSWPAWWPAVAATVTGYAVMALGLRRRYSATVVGSVAVVAVALMAVATAVPGATWFGLPTGRTPHRVDLALAPVRDALDGWHWPVAGRPGVVLLAAGVAGLAAVAARGLAGSPRRWRPAAGLIPPLVLVAASSLAVTDAGAVWTAGALVLAAGATVVADDLAGRGGDGHRPPDRGRLVAGAALVAAALVTAAVTGIAVGSPSPSSTGAGAGGSGPAVTPTGLALASDLVGLERRDPRVVLFHARTPTNTYWQLGLLTEWRGGQWVPDAATEAVLGATPTPPTVALAPTPAPRGTTASQVTMAALSSRLLPAPPGAVSVTPPGRAQVTAIGVVAPQPLRTGEGYTVTAAVAPSTADLGRGLDEPAGAPAASPSELATADVVPAVPAEVLTLAQQVTAGASTPLAKAEALVDWFRSGAFRYTLDPPAAPRGTDPLVAFLTTTRAGTCESFASAFTVMARAVGLPTRVAIGFTGGTRRSDGTTTVRGADAHAWPQVHLGAAGWVSFEPTPQLPSGELSPPDVVGPTALTPPTPAAPATTAVPSPPVRHPGGSVPTTAPAPSTTTQASTSSSTTAPTTTPTTRVGRPLTDEVTLRGWWLVLWWAAVVLVALIVVGGAIAIIRGRRRARTRARWAHEGLVGSYRRALAPLEGTAWARPPSESPVVHARRLAAIVDRRVDTENPDSGAAATAQLSAAVAELATLAALVEQQVYASRPASPHDATWASEAATRVGATLADPALGATSSSRPVPTTPVTGPGR